jgi:acetyl esterase/lipase
MHATPLPESVQVLSDLVYLAPDRGEKLDVYLPANSFSRPRPAILLIHGGGWRIGDKADARERNIGRTLAARGYVVFSINYLLNVGEKDPATGRLRLSRLAWPQNLHDCKTALRYIRAHASRHGVDPGRIGVMGGSAGGHLSMLLGATARHADFNRHGLYQDQPNDVACILNFYGDYDVRGRIVSPFEGATPAETDVNANAASPVVHFDDTLPPLFITHGTADTIIPVERSRLLAEHLRNTGRDYVYIEIAGAPHSYDLQPAQYDLRPAVLAFLQQHLEEKTSADATQRPAASAP